MWLIRLHDDVWRAASEQAHHQGWPSVDAYVESCVRSGLLSLQRPKSDHDCTALKQPGAPGTAVLVRDAEFCFSQVRERSRHPVGVTPHGFELQDP
jgi:hypothetical protein